MRDNDVPFVHQITVPNPGVGAEWRLTASGQGTLRVVAARALLTTSAVVANRLAALTISDGTDLFATIPAPAAITASKAGIVSTMAGAPSVGATDGPLLYPSPTDGWVLLPGWSIGSLTAGLDVGDQWSAIRMYVVEYPTGPKSRYTPDVVVIGEDR